MGLCCQREKKRGGGVPASVTLWVWLQVKENVSREGIVGLDGSNWAGLGQIGCLLYFFPPFTFLFLFDFLEMIFNSNSNKFDFKSSVDFYTVNFVLKCVSNTSVYSNTL